MKVLKLMAVVGAVLAGFTAAAHEKHGDRAMGVIETATPQRIVVKTADGHPVAFTVTPETRFLRGDKPARADDVRVGKRAVVHGKPVGETLRAVEVKLAPENGNE